MIKFGLDICHNDKWMHFMFYNCCKFSLNVCCLLYVFICVQESSAAAGLWGWCGGDLLSELRSKLLDTKLNTSPQIMPQVVKSISLISNSQVLVNKLIQLNLSLISHTCCQDTYLNVCFYIWKMKRICLFAICPVNISCQMIERYSADVFVIYDLELGR